VAKEGEMRETALDSHPQTDLPETRSAWLGGTRTSDIEGSSAAPALMLPPRLGVLRRPAESSPVMISRLVVPISLSDLDEALLGRLIWELATAAQVGVLLVAKVTEPQEESPIRRRLATIAALVRCRQSPVEPTVVYSSSWIHALRQVVREGDLIVCPSEEASSVRPPRKTVADLVISDLGLPAYLLDGVLWELAPPSRGRMGAFLAWAAALAVLAVFAGMQVEIVLQTQGWLQSSLLAATVGLELTGLLAVEQLVAPWM
jgi:hypothetical protein